MGKHKDIEVVPYDPHWPHLFKNEEKLIQEALNKNCIAVYHVGSTSVPGLSAKPTIDIIAVVKNGNSSILQLQKAEFEYKGEWNIPFKYGFTKRNTIKVNLHVYEENDPEVELNLKFRDHLRTYSESLEEYEQLKAALLSNPESFTKKDGALFSEYNLGKDAFIRKILQKEEFLEHRFLKVTHFKEWEDYHRIRKEQIFNPINKIYNPQHPSICESNNYHFILCEGVNVVTVAHIKFIEGNEAVLCSLATDTPYQGQGWGEEMMSLLEKWLKKEGRRLTKIKTLTSTTSFFL